MSDRIPDEIVEKLWEELNVGAPPSRGHLRRALEAVLPDLQQPQPGEPHEIDRAFYDLTVKERDFERQRADRLAAKCEQLTQEALDERATFKAMLEKFKDDDRSPIQQELADAILERDAMREIDDRRLEEMDVLGAERDAAWEIVRRVALHVPVRNEHGYPQHDPKTGKELWTWVADDRELEATRKQAEAARDARPDLTPEESEAIVLAIGDWLARYPANPNAQVWLAQRNKLLASARAKLESPR